MSQTQSFSRAQIILHWATVLLVAFQILMHEGIVTAWQARMDGVVPNVPTPNPHAMAGVTILILILARLWYRLRDGVPDLPAEEPAHLKVFARAVHWLLYGLVIVLALTGAGAWFSGVGGLGTVHALTEKLLVLTVLIHVAGALVQHFWFKTNVLKRMLGMK